MKRVFAGRRAGALTAVQHDPFSTGAEAPRDDAAVARAALLMRLRRSGIRRLEVLRAMEAVPRGLFVARGFAALAARDVALPIECGQTMLRPSFVARSLEALDCKGSEAVLEIGSGSGYVTALLARMTARVHGIERFRTLAEAADRRLQELFLPACTVSWGDGLSPSSPASYDRIILHAAVPALPPIVLERLAPDGVVVYPCQEETGQVLKRASRIAGGALVDAVVMPCAVTLALPGRSTVL